MTFLRISATSILLAWTAIHVDAQQVGVVSGTVLHAKSKTPIDGSFVTIGVDTAHVDVNGRFRFDGLTPGHATVYARAEGFYWERVSIIVDIDHTTEVDFLIAEEHGPASVKVNRDTLNPIAPCSCETVGSPVPDDFERADRYLDGYLDYDFVFSGWPGPARVVQGPAGGDGIPRYAYTVKVYGTRKGALPDTVDVVTDAGYCTHLLDFGEHLFFLNRQEMPIEQSGGRLTLTMDPCETPAPIPSWHELLRWQLRSPTHQVSYWKSPAVRAEFDRWMQDRRSSSDAEGIITGWAVDADSGAPLSLKSSDITLHISDASGREIDDGILLDHPKSGIFKIMGVRPGVYRLTLLDTESGQELASTGIRFLGGSRFVALRASYTTPPESE